MLTATSEIDRGAQPMQLGAVAGAHHVLADDQGDLVRRRPGLERLQRQGRRR